MVAQVETEINDSFSNNCKYQAISPNEIIKFEERNIGDMLLERVYRRK